MERCLCFFTTFAGLIISHSHSFLNLNRNFYEKTILFDKHSNLNAKMSPFGGYLMPMQYEGIIKEHEATRNAAAF